MRRIALTILLLAALPLACDSRPEAADSQDSSTTEPALDRPQSLADASWPCFHGDPTLAGYSPYPLGPHLALRWRFPAQAPCNSSPAIAAGRVFFGSDDGHLYALDLATGRLLWKYPIGDPVESTPLVLDSTVYVGADDGALYALDAATGDLRWSYAADADIKGGINHIPNHDPPALLFGSYDSKLHCLDAATGNLLWTHAAQSYINGTPAASADSIVFGSCDAALHILDPAGHPRFSVDTGAYIPGSPAIDATAAYTGNYNCHLLAVDTVTGQTLWQHEGSDPIFTTPALASDLVVYADQPGHVTALDRATGDHRWTFTGPDSTDTSPVIAVHTVVVADVAGNVTLLALTTGHRRASFSTGSAVTAGPALAAGLILFATNDASLYCLDTYVAEGN